VRKGYACFIRLVSIGERNRPRPVGKFYRRRSSVGHCTYSVAPSQVSSFIEIKMGPVPHAGTQVTSRLYMRDLDLVES
jgi:hypothetical protein